MRSLLILASIMLSARLVLADGLTGTFTSIDGGTLAVEDWRGHPVLVVNTASRCGYTYQYQGLQALYDQFRARGLIVLAVPSDDFNQELESAAEVRDFCELTYGLDLPMTDITPVKGASAHPFYRRLRESTGFSPRWNFNKILLDSQGEVVATWRSATEPRSQAIVRQIEALLN